MKFGEVEGYTAMTAESPTLSAKVAGLYYLSLDNAGCNDAGQVKKLKEAGTTEGVSVAQRFAIAMNPVHDSLIVSIPGVPAEHLFDGRDVSLCQESFTVCAAEGVRSNAIDHHCHGSVGTPDTVKYDEFIDNLSGRSSLAMKCPTDESDKGCVAGIEATPPRLESSSSGAMVRIPFINYILYIL